jgi:hypothetical protein
LVLEGFRLLPEWGDTVGGKIRTRVWTTGHSLEKDSAWMRQYNAQVRLDKQSARSTQVDNVVNVRTCGFMFWTLLEQEMVAADIINSDREKRFH